MSRLVEILQVYYGSNGDATKALYAHFETFGPAGFVAVNLFRAHKCSVRAKLYRGGGYRGMAYDRKNWAIGNLCAALQKHAPDLNIEWGWKEDSMMSPEDPHRWVLYVDLPSGGQVSFHNRGRGDGPSYGGVWDETTKNRGHDIIAHWMVAIEGVHQ